MFVVRYVVEGFITKEKFDTYKEAEGFYNKILESNLSDYLIEIDLYKESE